MNAKELRDLFASGRAYVACDGERLIDEATAREADAIAARALGLLAATEGEEGTADIAGLVEALGHQQQCDEDGVMCIVSRQAVDEASTTLASLAARVAELEREVRIAAGMLSTTPGFSDKHPQVALDTIQDAARSKP